METRASYALIGVFTLAVIAGAFGFVFWFSGGEKPGARTPYKVVFTGPVSGLSTGAWVLFNGVRVGEVTKIDFMPQDPSHVFALIGVDSRVPVRTDTTARLEYTSLTGVASIQLEGGSIDAPPLQTSAKEPGVIHAERSDFQNLVAAARHAATLASDLFTKSNRLLDENSAALTTSVKNIENFSNALAANPDDVKKIISEFASLSVKLDKAADKFDGVLTNLNTVLSADGSKGPLGDVSAAAKSIKKAADNLDSRVKGISDNINRFAGSGLRQYEALAADGRKTLEQINSAIRSLENNPQQLLFGKSSQIPEYPAAH
jgi:phospholipid/cholesterol/gamma-HCH transport system substrate-binding protein